MNVLNRFTLRSLKKNRSRTLVTIIGIILSAAMFTAVTTCISSLQGYMLSIVVATEGAWEGAAHDADAASLASLDANGKTGEYTALRDLGCAEIGSHNEYKPYLQVFAASENVTDLLSIRLTSGEMPKNSSEILLPKHLATNGGVRYALGDTVRLDLGTRSIDGERLGVSNGYMDDETFTATGETREYTVVGFYERPSFESYNSAGYTALTLDDGSGPNSFSVYLTADRMKDIFDLMDEEFPDNEIDIHYDILRYSGKSNETSFNRVLYSMAGILMAIIMLGSISLIYNAFSISVGERTRQLGILKSVGATGSQVIRSVLYEGLLLCIIGIPLGVLAGIGGIAVTLKFTAGWFRAIASSAAGVDMTVHVSIVGVAVAVAIGVVTVVLSALIPARRAVKTSPIEAIRQTADISVRAKSVKTPKYVYKLFGFEGMLADKNFRRNRRKYRATVLSLFLSVLLFVSASSFCAYMGNSVNTLMTSSGYDLTLDLEKDNASEITAAALASELGELSEISELTYYSKSYVTIADSDALSEDYIAYTNGNLKATARVCFIEDAAYRAYLESLGLDAETLMNADAPKAVALNNATLWDPANERYVPFEIISGFPRALSTETMPDSKNGKPYAGSEETETGDILYLYGNDSDDFDKYTYEEAVVKLTHDVAAVASELPYCLDDYSSGAVLTLMYPYSAADAMLAEEPYYTTFAMMSDDPSAAEEKVSSLLTELALPTDSLYNYAAGAESTRAIVGIVNVFSYGFIVLISLIALANVFNTVSTNIMLRRREFAMLKSVGMTRKSFNRMMNFECFLYGAKGLIYGIPASVVVTFLIYLGVSNGLKTGFYIPWYSIVIAVASVFIVVFATMLFSMSKIKRENPIDALKQD